MRVSTIGPDLVQLTRFGCINAYLVREKDGWTLIDTGVAGSARAILAAAAEHGAPIRRIVLTHGHNDHAGALNALAAALPEAEVMVGAREARLMAGDRTLAPGEPQAKVPGQFSRPAVPPARLLEDGDRIGALRVVDAPGHTPGQIALLDERHGTLFAGDAYVVTGGLAVPGVWRWTFPFPVFATWHKPTALATARRLAALRPAALAAGHGAVLDQPGAAMAEAIDEMDRLLGGARVAPV
jgi:glyoxylase-like metal-dependent hydrolase (beta-lactamase superfamily II)